MRPAAKVGSDDRFIWGVPASVVLHGLLVLALLVAPRGPLPDQPSEKTVSVSILTPDEFGAATRPPPVLAAPPAPTPKAVPPVAAPEAPPGMIRATTMLSGKTLADPRSRSARRDLATFADSERVAQLCNLEAMDQIGAWRHDFRPETVVAYARSNERIVGDTIEADGAAFRSRTEWYDLKFHCEVAPSHDKVVAFAFQVGDPVPRKLWDELGLTPDGGTSEE
jgi:hypothetical protein